MVTIRESSMVNPASEAALNTEHALNFMFDYRAQVDSQDSTFKCTGCKVELDKLDFKKKVDFEASKKSISHTTRLSPVLSPNLTTS